MTKHDIRKFRTEDQLRARFTEGEKRLLARAAEGGVGEDDALAKAIDIQDERRGQGRWCICRVPLLDKRTPDDATGYGPRARFCSDACRMRARRRAARSAKRSG